MKIYFDDKVSTTYISSSGFSLCPFIVLNWVGDIPVCDLNCVLR